MTILYLLQGDQGGIFWWNNLSADNYENIGMPSDVLQLIKHGTECLSSWSSKNKRADEPTIFCGFWYPLQVLISGPSFSVNSRHK